MKSKLVIVLALVGFTASVFANTNKVVKTEKVGSSRVDLQACKLEYSIVSPK